MQNEILISGNGIGIATILKMSLLSQSEEFAKAGIEVSEEMKKSLRFDGLQFLTQEPLVIKVLGDIAIGIVVGLILKLFEKEKPNVNVTNVNLIQIIIQDSNETLNIPKNLDSLKKYLPDNQEQSDTDSSQKD